MPYHTWKCVPTAISGGVDTSMAWVSLVTDEYAVRVTKILSRIGVSWTCSLTFYFWSNFNSWIMIILSKGYKPDNFESQNSLKLSFENIWGFCLNFVECESFLESNSPDILALCQTHLDDSIDSGNIFVRVYLAIMWKDCITHMHGLARLNSHYKV